MKTASPSTCQLKHLNFVCPLTVEAEQAYRRAVELDSADTLAHRGLGLAMARQDKHAEAEYECRLGVELDPEDPLGHFNLARTLARQRETTEAVTSLRRAIELDSSYRDRAWTDSDFDPIRDESEFKRLVEQE